MSMNDPATTVLTKAPAAAPLPDPVNVYAVISLVAALLGLFPVAIVFGVLTFTRPAGRGIAIAGLVLGVLRARNPGAGVFWCSERVHRRLRLERRADGHQQRVQTVRFDRRDTIDDHRRRDGDHTVTHHDRTRARAVADKRPGPQRHMQRGSGQRPGD